MCPLWKRGVGVFAIERSTPTVETVEPSGGDNHLLENRLLKLFLCGNWNPVDT